MNERLTIPQAATLAGVSRQTIWLWCRLDGIGQKVGRDWLISRPALEARMARRAK